MKWLRGGGIAGFIVRQVAARGPGAVPGLGHRLRRRPRRSVTRRARSWVATPRPDRLAALQKQLNLDQLDRRPVLPLARRPAARRPRAPRWPRSSRSARVLGPRLVNSAVLVVIAAVISIPLSIAIGSYAALRREKSFDTVSLEPDAGARGAAGVRRGGAAGHPVLDHGLPLAAGDQPGAARTPSRGTYPDELILPVATLVIAVAPYVSRIMRASMIEVLESDYVEMARLKGLPERTVLDPARAAERDRAGLPGDRDQPRLPGRRRRRRSSTSSTTPASAAR